MALARVQGTAKVLADNAASIAITLSTLPTVGNALIVPITAWGGSGFPTGGCTDNRGNTYQRAVVATNVNVRAVVYYCASVVTSSAPFTITVTPTGNTYMAGSAIEVSGVGSGLAVDQTSTGVSAGADALALSGATPALTASEVLLVGAMGCNTTKPSITVQVLSPTWTQEIEELSNAHAVGETDTRIITSAAGTTPSAQWTLGGADSWAAALAAFAVPTPSAQAVTGATLASTVALSPVTVALPGTGSLQVHLSRANFTALSSIAYTPPVNGGHAWQTVEARALSICPAAGTFSNLQVTLRLAPGAGQSLTFTLRKNGADTAAVVVVSGSALSGSYTGTPVALADGDELSIRVNPSASPTLSDPCITWDFTSTVPGESIYGLADFGEALTADRTHRVLSPAYATSWNPSAAMVDIVACPGALTKATIKISADVGGSGSLTFTILKNGVAQNGAAGTPDTRIAFATGTTKASATFTLPVAVGDLLQWQLVRTGTPVSVRPTMSICLTATTPGQSHYGAANAFGIGHPGAGGVEYAFLHGSAGSGGSDETFRALTVGVSGFALKNLQAALNGTAGPTTSDGDRFTVWKNGASSGHTVDVKGSSVTGGTTATTTLVTGDTLTMQLVGLGSPTNRGVNWALLQDTNTVTPVTVLIVSTVTLHPVAVAADVVVPDVVGMTEAAAATALGAVGLVSGTVTLVPHLTIAAGIVLSQLPLAGAAATVGSAVALVVSAGPLAPAPTVEATATSASGADVMTHVVTMPSGLVAGDLLVSVVVFDSNPVAHPLYSNPILTWPSDWFPTEIFGSSGGAGVGPKMAMAYKIAAGSDTLTITSDAPERSVHVTYRLRGFQSDCLSPVMSTYPGGGSGASVTYQPLTPTGATQACLWLGVVGWDNGTITPSAGTTVNADGSATGVGLSAGPWTTNVARTFAPAPLTLSAATPWECFTVAVLPDLGPVVEPSFADVIDIGWPVAKQDSGMLRPHYMNRPPWGSDPVDPDYPRILSSEAVKVITVGGRNVLTTDRAEGEDAAVSGVALFELGPDGPAPGNPSAGDSGVPSGGWWNAAQCRCVVDYQLEDVAWTEGAYHVLSYLTIEGGADVIGLAASLDPISSAYPSGVQEFWAFLELRYTVWDAHLHDVAGGPDYIYVGWHPLARPLWTNRRVRFTMTWQCGTVTVDGGGAILDVASDGFALVDMTDLSTNVTTRIFNLQALPLVLSDGFYDGSPGRNYLNGVWLGYYGLFGHLEGFRVATPGPPAPPEILLRDGPVGLTWVEFTPRGEVAPVVTGIPAGTIMVGGFGDDVTCTFLSPNGTTLYPQPPSAPVPGTGLSAFARLSTGHIAQVGGNAPTFPTTGAGVFNGSDLTRLSEYTGSHQNGTCCAADALGYWYTASQGSTTRQFTRLSPASAEVTTWDITIPAGFDTARSQAMAVSEDGLTAYCWLQKASPDVDYGKYRVHKFSLVGAGSYVGQLHTDYTDHPGYGSLLCVPGSSDLLVAFNRFNGSSTTGALKRYTSSGTVVWTAGTPTGSTVFYWLSLALGLPGDAHFLAWAYTNDTTSSNARYVWFNYATGVPDNSRNFAPDAGAFQFDSQFVVLAQSVG